MLFTVEYPHCYHCMYRIVAKQCILYALRTTSTDYVRSRNTSEADIWRKLKKWSLKQKSFSLFMPDVFRVDNYIRHHPKAAIQQPRQCICFEILSNQFNLHIEYLVKLFLIISKLEIHGDHFWHISRAVWKLPWCI